MKNLLLYIFLFVLVGCRSASTRELELADSLMESNPDSALAILQQIDTASLSTACDDALYGLLLTQAQVKCDVYRPEPVRISSALEYFSEHGPKQYLMRAYFYDGVTNYHLADYQKSVHDALSAYDLAQELGEVYWQAKSSELIADNFAKNFNSHDALPYSAKAVELYEKSGHHLNALFSTVDYAINLGASHDRKKSEEMVDSVYRIAQNELGDSMLMAYCLQAQLANAKSLENYGRVIQICEKLKEFDDFYPLTAFGYYALSEAYIGKGDISAAEHIVKDILESESLAADSISLLQAQAKLFEAQGDIDSAYVKFKKLLNLDYRGMKSILENSITATQRDFFTVKAKIEHNRNNRIKSIVIIVSLVLLALISSAVVIITAYIRLKKSELESKVAEILDLGQIIEMQRSKNKESDERILGMNELVENLFKARWNTLNTLCGEFYEKKESKVSRTVVLERIEKELEKIKDDNELKQIEQVINNFNENIIDKLRIQCPFLSESDLKFITYNIAGLSYRTICLLLDIKRTNFYQKRFRIMSKIQESEAPDKDLFINKLKLRITQSAENE